MRRIVRFLLAVLALFGAAGCSTLVEREKPLAIDVAGASLDAGALVPPLIALKGVRAQALSGQWNDRAFTAECVIRSDGETAVIVLLAPHMRLMTLRLSKPRAISCDRARMVPAAFEPEYALMDLALVNLDTAALRAALGPSFRVQERGNVRRVFTSAGALLAERTQQEGGNVLFVNHLWGYNYTLTPQAVE